MSDLNRKYRPMTFDALVGQRIPARLLSGLVRAKAPRHVLLYGPYGAGKTSAARIYARALTCEEPSPTGQPCNSCESCTLALEDRHSDILEVVGTVSGGKDEILRLKEIAITTPLLSGRRVILVDEAQGLSKQA